MPTTKCSCGEELHYSTDKVGLIARCRCGRPVRLPEPPPVKKPKTYEEVLDEEQRAASRRRQIIAVLAFAIVTFVVVLIFARFNHISPARQPQRVAPTADEP